MERLFHLRELGASVKTELLAGVTTFVTMAYIIFVNPVILSGGGYTGSDAIFMDFGAVMVATCLAAALASIFMGIVANYPIALAPAMGENAVFASFVAAGLMTWEMGLAAVLISGGVFFLLTFLKVRQLMIDAIPQSLKQAIAAGIGVFIAWLGLIEGGIITKPAGPLAVDLGDPYNPAVWTTVFGLIIAGGLMARKIKGAILWTILATTLFALCFKVTRFYGVLERPPSLAPTLMKFDFRSLMNINGLMIIIIFLFMDVFDSIGTFIGVGQAGGFLKEGKLPRAKRALSADATGTVAGALLGTSTVTSYIESAAGVAAGARTGLANIATGLLFLLALFFFPLVKMVGDAFLWQGGFYHPITAPALIVTGCLMFKNIGKIAWDDMSEAIPSLMIVLGIALTYSIADGLALGLILYPAIKLIAGKGRSVSPMIYILGILCLARFIWLRF